jgi:hypothetical protein
MPGLAATGVLIIATPEHWDLFSRQLSRLGADLQSLLKSEQLVLFDAQNTPSRVMVGGLPDWNLFEGVVASSTYVENAAAVSDDVLRQT